MAEALKVRNEESQGSASVGGRQAPAWMQSLAGYPRRFRQFLHEVSVEMRHVTWPTRDDVRATTLVVIVTVFFFGFYLFGMDYMVGWGVERVLKAFRR